ncbi:MAG: RluA family pseudouridine synthase [Anaeromicrobium sp.]|uniref:RluA family pseudouridine synthase n=1 Tax=Anaeromicrobium sp. TaxID=1929132 RepID=UPI0025F2E421|nr:RluA family pseudouridine synthase [Anaeromicrobium sp.]MCT4594911.1 RluA family pseudouridine synthase [Anaeromicrobium sp.]
MDLEIFSVQNEDSKKRLDAYISSKLENESRNYIQKLIQDGNVSVGGKVETSKKYKVKGGDSIEVSIPEPEILKVEAQDIPIEIVYEDDQVVVVNKPRDMVVHPAPGHKDGTLVNALLYHCEYLSSINGIIRPGIVHRIDKDTSGLLMVAKNNFSHNFLAEQLKDHSITRKYMAIVHGNIKENRGTIEAPIGRHPVDRLKRWVVTKNSKHAITHFKVVERFGDYTLIEAQLETGRTHQIRVHMAYIKHPLIGDPLYGVKKEKINIVGQALHAKTLGFIHPKTKEYLEFDSQLPEYFSHILEKLRNSKK